nr:hypothetical protein [Acidimicrobiia bacterium]
RRAPDTVSEPATKRAPEANKQRSPSTLRRLLGQVERELAEDTERRDTLSAELGAASASGSGGGHLALAGLAQDLAGVESRIAELEERWLALADELGG